MLKRFLKDEKGSTAIEYGLIAALIGLAIVSSLTTIGTHPTVTMTNISSHF